MTDIVITIAQDKWSDWLAQHGPGDNRGRRRNFHLYGERPPASEGDFLYVAAHAQLRCVLLIERIVPLMGGWLVWATMMHPVTLAGAVRGFTGWQRRWWPYADELPFPDWRSEGALFKDRADYARAMGEVPAYAHGKTAATQGGSSA